MALLEASAATKVSAVLLCLDYPPGLEFGCDGQAWRVGERFRGMKLLPPGLHYFTYSAGRDLRQGMFLDLGPGQVVVRRWDPCQEDLLELADPDELMRYELGVRRFDFDDGLAPYTPAIGHGWRALAAFVTTEVIKRCGVSTGSRIGIVESGDGEGLRSPVKHGEKEEKDISLETDHRQDHQQEQLNQDRPRAPAVVKACFTPLLEARRRRPGMKAADITRYNLDPTRRVQDLVDDAFGGDFGLFLGEFQLAFVLFLTVSSLDGLEHWKAVVATFCACEGAIESKPDHVAQFLQTLAEQLGHIPADFFSDPISGPGNFLMPCLCDLFALVAATTPEPAAPAAEDEATLRQRAAGRRNLAAALDGLRIVTKTRFKVDFADEAVMDAAAAMSECAPVIVELESGGSSGPRTEAAATALPECDGDVDDNDNDHDDGDCHGVVGVAGGQPESKRGDAGSGPLETGKAMAAAAETRMSWMLPPGI